MLFRDLIAQLDREAMADTAAGLLDAGMSPDDVAEEVGSLVEAAVNWKRIIPNPLLGMIAEDIVEDALIDLVVKPMVRQLANPEARKAWVAKRKAKREKNQADRADRRFTQTNDPTDIDIIIITRVRDGKKREVTRLQLAEGETENLREMWKRGNAID